VDVEVLIVDDDEDVRTLMVEVLSQHGYQARGASDGEEALQLIAAGLRPKVVIVDLCMPRMDGVSLWEAVESRLGVGAPAVLFCSGSPQARQRPDGAPLLAKPFELVELLEWVARLIGPPFAVPGLVPFSG
jgi:CheY-like chemotaxis protein